MHPFFMGPNTITQENTMRFQLRCFTLLCALMLAVPATAAGLRVVPLKLEMTARGGTATLELTNLTRDNMGLQVEAKAWAQAEGADVYTDTQDLLFAPPIIAIPAGKTKTVRFRLRRGPSPDHELAYRIYAQQLAAAPDNSTDESTLAGGVEVRLRLGIPLFVAAIKPQPPGLEASAIHTPGNTALRLKNPGRTHLKIMQAEVVDGSGAVVAETNRTDTQTNYLLPGSESTWPLHLPQRSDPATLAPGRYTLRVKTDFYSPRAVTGFSSEGIATRTLDVAP